MAPYVTIPRLCNLLNGLCQQEQEKVLQIISPKTLPSGGRAGKVSYYMQPQSGSI